MPLKTYEKATGDAPVAAVIVMHGLGASPNDFASFVWDVDLSAVGPVRWVFPAAPIQPVTINGGVSMPSWYDILTLDAIADREHEPSLRASAALVQEVIDREVGRGIPASRIVLGGFSQGCAMALLTGLRAPQRLAGLLGMSGYLPLAAKTAAERHAANHDVPVFLGHGVYDPVVPFKAAVASRTELERLGHPVEWHEYPMQHNVVQEEVEDIAAWLRRVLTA